MINKICFYNYFHNGDCVATKSFVAEFINKLPNFEYYYAHNNHPKIISDLKCSFIKIPQNLPYNLKFCIIEDTLFINTWVGAYISDCQSNDVYYNLTSPLATNICWKTYYEIWEFIFKVISNFMCKELKLDGSAKDYAHEIDYSKFDCGNIDAFINNNHSKRIVLISNGLVESNQTNINNNMSSYVNNISDLYKEDIFICTRKFDTNKNNILFTQDIIDDRSGNDLNEIAYLSKFANIIIGRNSGPFLFTNTKENLNNNSKKFLSFGNSYGHCFPAFIENQFNCEFTFIEDKDEQSIVDGIKHILI